MNPIETISGIDYGRCITCRGRTSVERGGKRCYLCTVHGGPAWRKAVLVLVLAAAGPGGGR
jgi:hypothetical protein